MYLKKKIVIHEFPDDDFKVNKEEMFYFVRSSLLKRV